MNRRIPSFFLFIASFALWFAGFLLATSTEVFPEFHLPGPEHLGGKIPGGIAIGLFGWLLMTIGSIAFFVFMFALKADKKADESN